MMIPPLDPVRPGVGELAPWFLARSGDVPQFHLSSLGGRNIVLCFPGNDTHTAFSALDLLATAGNELKEVHAVCFGVVPDADAPFLQQRWPRLRFFHDDATYRLRQLYNIPPAGGWIVIDTMMRILIRAPLEAGVSVLQQVASLPASGLAGSVHRPAPVLTVPGIFEPEFCRYLVSLYQQQGGTESGFMRDVNGQTVGVVDHSFKRRQDLEIQEEAVRIAARQRIERRLIPMITRALNFRTTRMERYIVACYDGSEGGFFRPHRDNTTRGTAHRRFAVTINLNEEEFEGGELRFPEFGPRTYRAPTGGAVVFCCTLLHEATPVTAGTRYAFLPFLYDEEAARQREANIRFLGDGTAQYKAQAS
ncbi:MAG: 2OG-Fe(II) oxygenase family protein [Niveispirillum sp.]|uniref:2OG-Fe(II) oxygenase family protein n=1 Tax=Niveispirillum sp. TaxID=1917217 RepID=UPI004036C73A